MTMPAKDSQPFFKPWHKQIVFWGIFWAFVWFFIYAIQQKTTQIKIDDSTISAIELRAVQDAIGDFGVVKLYNANLNEIADRVKHLSWVKSVQVSRDWQKGIVVRVHPKTAVANFGVNHLMDTSGDVFVPADMGRLSDESLTNLYGDGSKSKEIMAKMHRINQWFLPVNLHVNDMVLTPRQTWLIRFDSGLRVTVDFERVDEKLYNLSRLLQYNKDILPVNDIAMIDLRYKNGFSLSKKQSNSHITSL